MDESLATRMPDLPAVAACRHLGAREGFEVLFARRRDDGCRLDGYSNGVEAGEAWAVRYSLTVDRDWRTRSARISEVSASGEGAVLLEGDGSGEWRIDGEPAPELAGCLEVDLEASGFTNLVPVRRLGLAVGERAEAPAAYARVPDLRVERLDQSYARLPDDRENSRYDYRAPAFDFHAVITYDADGVVGDYPGIAVRVA
jgi:uncharacterized protein